MFIDTTATARVGRHKLISVLSSKERPEMFMGNPNQTGGGVKSGPSGTLKPGRLSFSCKSRSGDFSVPTSHERSPCLDDAGSTRPE